MKSALETLREIRARKSGPSPEPEAVFAQPALQAEPGAEHADSFESFLADATASVNVFHHARLNRSFVLVRDEAALEDITLADRWWPVVFFSEIGELAKLPLEGLRAIFDLRQTFGPSARLVAVQRQECDRPSQLPAPSPTSRDAWGSSWPEQLTATQLAPPAVDTVTIWKMTGPGTQRRWELRRDGHVLAETEVEDHAKATSWIADLRAGRVPSGIDGEAAHPPEDAPATVQRGVPGGATADLFVGADKGEA